MFKFSEKNISVNIPESQIRETILRRHSMSIKLFNLASVELINENTDTLYKIFAKLREKNKFGNFIDMREI